MKGLGIFILLFMSQCAEKQDSFTLVDITEEFHKARVITNSVRSSLVEQIHSDNVSSFRNLMAEMDSLVFEELPEHDKESLKQGYYWALPMPSDNQLFSIPEKYTQLTQKIFEKKLISEKVHGEILDSLSSNALEISASPLPEAYHYISVLRQILQKNQSSPIITKGPQ